MARAVQSFPLHCPTNVKAFSTKKKKTNKKQSRSWPNEHRTRGNHGQSVLEMSRNVRWVLSSAVPTEKYNRTVEDSTLRQVYEFIRSHGEKGVSQKQVTEAFNVTKVSRYLKGPVGNENHEHMPRGRNERPCGVMKLRVVVLVPPRQFSILEPKTPVMWHSGMVKGWMLIHYSQSCSGLKSQLNSRDWAAFT